VRFSARRGSNLRFASVLPIVVLAVVPLSCSSAPGPQRMRHPDTGAKSIRNQKGIEMVWIPPGTFTMGSTDAEIQAAYEDSKRASPQFATDTAKDVPEMRLLQIFPERRGPTPQTGSWEAGQLYEVAQDSSDADRASHRRTSPGSWPKAEIFRRIKS
jgi:hypothetical protein